MPSVVRISGMGSKQSQGEKSKQRRTNSGNIPQVLKRDSALYVESSEAGCRQYETIFLVDFDAMWWIISWHGVRDHLGLSMIVPAAVKAVPFITYVASESAYE